ncbi:pleckstrin -like protein [Labeo rohita]|uniref:Pleckstrin-like protein n=1 Tax=Labeo rohita TaxID=84645 RepID=A0A498NNS8_LABRO|nr:pleckstrin -like protein [Labeo rohita]
MAPEESALDDKNDRQREEEKEADTDTPDGSALPSVAQKRAQEKHRYNTVGYQKKKQRAAVDFSTVGKGTSVVVKSRGALKQALFSQGVSDKNGTLEERSVGGQLDALKQVLDAFNIPADLRWAWGEGGAEITLEKSWTDIVDSHEWVENHPQCGRMRLGDMQAKPHQRITKYPLLLKAVQKTTEDLPTKNALERMLNSVNNFLESINGYLQFKEDTLALSAAAQRIEGYKIEGLSEELDKELVVLLFTDVLLMTKTQKKSEKLKVVRPPLPLERIHCIELRDGYSFVLVEVGDLGCAVSVNFLSTPSPDSCASWVSALRETQAALETLRKNETNKTLETVSTTDFGGSERPIQDELSDKVMGDPDGQSVSDRSDSDIDTAEHVRLHPFHTRKSETEMLMDVEQSKVQQLDRNSSLIGQQNDQSQSAHEEVVGKTDTTALKTEEGRNKNYSKQLDEEEGLSKISERRVTWKHGRRSSSNSKDVAQQDLPVRNQSNGSFSSLPGGDMKKNGTSSQSLPSTSAPNKLPIPASAYGAHGEPMHPNQEDDSQEIRRNSLYSQSGDDDQFLTESGRFSRKLKSPRIRRRRPNNVQPSLPSDSSRTTVNGLELTSNAKSNTKNQRRESDPSIKSQDSHRVLKLGSLKNNHGTLWNVPEKKLSPVPQTHSEPEQTHDGKVQKKPIKLKKQRSASIPEIRSLPPSHRHSPSPPPGLDPQLHPSPLQDLLQRAKEREKERGLGKRKGKKKTVSLQNSPTISASPSPSVSEGEREAEREESAVPRMISAHGWREGNVDGSEDEMKESNNVLEGISVDWPGWCFDDEEVFDFQYFDDENWFGKNQTTNEPRMSETKDETECSEV